MPESENDSPDRKKRRNRSRSLENPKRTDHVVRKNRKSKTENKKQRKSRSKTPESSHKNSRPRYTGGEEQKSRSKSPERTHKSGRPQNAGDEKQRSRSKSAERSHRSSRSRYNGDEDNPDVHPRYYGEDRPNSDSYWNKYPRKDNTRVGQRYYDGGTILPKGKKKEGSSNSRIVEKEKEDKSVIKPRERKTVDLLTSRTGGAYIPPAKLRMMQENITDKSSAAYQRIAWEALKKSIHGYINKINISNIGIIAREILHENIVRGRGLLCKSIIQAQAASPTFTNVYAALVAVINSKFPNIGELLLKRLVLQFKRGFKQNNKSICISATTFVAHLVNQRVAHEILALEILTLLVENPTDDSVEVAISFLKECGQKLTEVSSKGITAIFEMLRNILHEGQLEKRIQYMIEVMFQIRKDGFKDHAAIIEQLDIVEEEDQFTHLITLDDVKQANSEDILNVFKFDDNYEENEGKYQTLSKEILGTDNESGSESEGEDDSDEEDEDNDAKDESKIIDKTETNLIVLRRTIYLTIQSSLDFEECAHKLLRMELKPGQEIELCHMFLDCCAEQRTYEKFYGLLAQRFCQINKTYVEPFQQIFKDTYATTHRLDANRLRNVSKFFAHLLFTDAISWEVLEIMKLNEEDTNSSSRIFIKILFQELAEYMGLGKLNARLKDESLQEYFAGLFPRDNPKNTRFSINFFTSIGLGGLTDELREHLKNIPKNIELNLAVGDQSDSSSSSSSSSSSDEESSSEESSSSEDEKPRKKKGQQFHNKRRKSPSKKHDSPHEEDKESGRRRIQRSRSLEEPHKRSSRKDDDARESKRKKDYQWVKSRYEDNIHQMKNDKKAFEKYSSRRRSHSRDRVMKKEEKDKRYKNKEGRERRRS